LDSLHAALLCAPVFKSKTSKLSKKVSCKQRVRRRASCINILGGILSSVQNLSMEISNRHPSFRQTNSSLHRHRLHHPLRDVHTCGRDAVAKFHRVIDLVDGQAIFSLEQIKRQQSPTYRPRRPLT